MIEEEDDPFGFACSCSDEGKAKIEAVWEWAAALNPKYNTDKLKSLNYALYRLEDWGAQLHFAADQWALIGSSNTDWKSEYSPGEFKTSTLCDDMTDGLIYTFRKWHDHFEGKSSREIRDARK